MAPKERQLPTSVRQKLHLAIVGGGRACKFFLELLKKNAFPLLDIQIVGVCDINPQAQGLRLARQWGIYTTDNFRDLFSIPKLDSIIELTNCKRVLLELIEERPAGVGIVDHNIGRLLRNLFFTGNRLQALEQELILEKMSSDFLIQHSNAAIAVLDTNFTIVEVNEAYLQMVKMPRERVIGAFCHQIHRGYTEPCPNVTPSLRCPMLETLRTGKSAHVIHEFAGHGMQTQYDNIVTYPLKNSDGNILKVIEIWRDITDEIASRWEKRMEQIKSHIHQLVQEDRMISLGKLVASCVHEINNPIQGLITFTAVIREMLEKGLPSNGELAQVKHFLSLMSRELERCGNITTGLLSFSRQTPSQFRDTDLNQVIESVVVLTQHKMDLQCIDLDLHLDSAPLVVHGDTNQLQQTILNLIFNAVEAMPGGGRLRISAGPDPQERKAVIEIEDNGQGIEAAYLDHLFDPFFTTKAEGQGTGLGLSIVYGVVKMHHGDVNVKSRPGRGTCFTLTLPLA
jgi:two-component system NtrC family sensor kinase